MYSGWWFSIWEPTDLTLILLVESLFLRVPQSFHNCPTQDFSGSFWYFLVGFWISFGQLLLWSVLRAATLISCLWIQADRCKHSLRFQNSSRRKAALQCVPIDNLRTAQHVTLNWQGWYCIPSCLHHTGLCVTRLTVRNTGWRGRVWDGWSRGKQWAVFNANKWNN